ncbi:metal ABC transporter solute-binding protein, Zn/Mn family [Roseicella frigidaeris]|uniref:Metal ABC transporter substrate-binding protein n=1 Tax=Roseicella frigidaeris TaxID=2230885 RepID=A0A327M546_9PROT|nr:zinc ABC transporter substrate-binding protein [Roseicella frigidaeris]RAI57545.1 metal ABC transporter substrate-binding protein [Roseicella frigidaeris]
MPVSPPRRALLPLAAACLLPRHARAEARPRIVASFSILGDMARQLGGGDLPLQVLAGPGTDPHLFQPRPSEAEAIRGAGLVIRNGLGFEPWLDRLLAATRHAGPLVTAAEGIAPLRAAPTGHAAGHGAEAPDPHAWQDARLAGAYARTIAAGLRQADPARAAAIGAAEADYLARLAGLDAWVRETLGAIPAARRVILTSHAAFGYFAAAYGVRVLAPQGLSPEAQPSAAQVAALIRQVRAEGIAAVFLEGQGSQAVMERLAADAGVRPRGRLYADSLSPPDGPAPTYEAMMRHNVGLMAVAMRG